MENGYGGPVWHASVAWQHPGGIRPILMLTDGQKREMWKVAGTALVGVGSIVLGEFRERLERSLHVKRRLSVYEWGGKPWGMDYRHSAEGWNRLNATALYLPPQFHPTLMAELNVATSRAVV